MYASIFVLAVYSAILVWTGWLARHRTESLDFHLGGRKVGFLKIGISTFSLVGGGEFVTLTALAYYFGMFSYVFFVGVVLGFIVLALLAKRIRTESAKHSYYSVPDFFAHHFGRVPAVIASILAFLSVAALLVIQLFVGGTLLASATGFPSVFCIVGMAVVLSIYVYLGGYNSILATDLIQGTCLAITMLVLVSAYFADPLTRHAGPMPTSVIPAGDALTLIFTGFFAVIGGADVWQRLCSARDTREATRGLCLAAGGWLVIGLLIVAMSVGIAMRHPGLENANTAFFTMLSSDLAPWLTGFVIMLLFSALLSTADTELFLAAMLVNREIHRGKAGHQQVDPPTETQQDTAPVLPTRTTRIFVLIIALVATAMAVLVGEDLISIYFILLYSMMILGPIVLARLLGRAPAPLALFGLIAGAITLFVLAFVGRLEGGWYALLVLAGPALSFVLRQGKPQQVDA